MKTTSTLLAEKIHTELFSDKTIPVGKDYFENLCKDISELNPECVDLLNEFKSSEEQIRFFKTDKEMRIKFPDVWQMQLEAEEIKYKSLTRQLIDFGTKNKLDIAAFLAAIDAELNNFDELFKRQ